VLDVLIGIPDENNVIKSKLFSWHCVKISNSTLTVQLEFADVMKISRKDIVRITFIKPEFLFNSENQSFKILLKTDYI